MTAASKLEPAPHPLLAALARAPIGEAFTPEQRAELDQQMEDIRRGRTKLVPHESRETWQQAHADELGEPDE